MKMPAFLRAAELMEAAGVTGLSDWPRVLGNRSPSGFAFSNLLTMRLAWSLTFNGFETTG
jgi:hypothetical protein